MPDRVPPTCAHTKVAVHRMKVMEKSVRRRCIWAPVYRGDRRRLTSGRSFLIGPGQQSCRVKRQDGEEQVARKQDRERSGEPRPSGLADLKTRFVTNTASPFSIAVRRSFSAHAIPLAGASQTANCGESSADMKSSALMPPDHPAPRCRVRPPRQIIHKQGTAPSTKSRTVMGPLVAPIRKAPASARIELRSNSIHTEPTVLSICQPRAPERSTPGIGRPARPPTTTRPAPRVPPPSLSRAT